MAWTRVLRIQADGPIVEGNRPIRIPPPEVDAARPPESLGIQRIDRERAVEQGKRGLLLPLVDEPDRFKISMSFVRLRRRICFGLKRSSIK